MEIINLNSIANNVVKALNHMLAENEIPYRVADFSICIDLSVELIIKDSSSVKPKYVDIIYISPTDMKSPIDDLIEKLFEQIIKK